MKKFIFAAVVAAVALISCSKEVNRSCYKVEYTTPAQEAVKDSTGTIIKKAVPATDFVIYKWASQTEIDACVKNWKEMGYTNVIANKQEKTEAGQEIKTMVDCLTQE